MTHYTDDIWSNPGWWPSLTAGRQHQQGQEKFDKSMVVFAEKYADQTESDFRSFKEKIVLEKLDTRKI